MHDDLTQFGVQVITRCHKRSSWWYSKCLWCAVLSFVFYILVLATVVIYAALLGYKFTFENNYWLCIRFSGNENVIRVFIEQDSEKHCDEILSELQKQYNLYNLQ